MIHSIKQLRGFYANMFLPKRTFEKTLFEQFQFYQKCFCHFSSTIIVLKSTTDDHKVSLTSIWVVFDATMLQNNLQNQYFETNLQSHGD